MTPSDTSWALAHLSDSQLLESLGSLLQAQRRSLAALVAHLGEVEERRLHLQAACSSMFAYCVERLGMSEDEACRRIEAARLARRFPALLAELESGRITLSVALVLKPVLSPSNHVELLLTARGQSTRRARELVSARFPAADAPSTVRKLPVPRTHQSSDRAPAPAAPSAPTTAVLPPTSEATPLFRTAKPSSALATAPPATPPLAASVSTLPASPATAPVAASMSPLLPPATWQSPPTAPPPAPPAPSPARSRIDPIAAQRYRVQFTADAALKEKLELARELLRHAHPGGDLAPVVGRALDLLLEQLLKRRFGARTSKAPLTSTGVAPTAPAPSAAATSTAAAPSVACAPQSAPRRTPMEARRAVLDRDGLGCSWVDANGRRCGSRAWLELDHQHPREQGGGCNSENLRWLCRAHNAFAAEQAYGRAHIARAIARRRAARAPDCAAADSHNDAPIRAVADPSTSG